MIEKVNLQDAVDTLDRLYVYRKIGGLNGNVLSVVQVENRTLDFHVHEDSDELFYVIEGTFQLETDDGILRINAGEFAIVPQGTRHRPVVGARAKFLMIERAGTLNKQNSGEGYEDPH